MNQRTNDRRRERGSGLIVIILIVASFLLPIERCDDPLHFDQIAEVLHGRALR